MANLTDEIKLLFRTSVADKDVKEVSKNIKSALENAAISFNEAETKRNLEPIVRMIQRVFDQAEMAFDADQLLAMPSQQALQKLAEMELDQLQLAFDKAVKKSGGLKIDFGDMDLSSITEPLNQLTKELEAVGERVANTTKKSVGDINEAIQRLNKQTSKKINTKVPVADQAKAAEKEVGQLDATVLEIEETLKRVDKPHQLKSVKTAFKALDKARQDYYKAVTKNDPWEVQYQHMLDFVSKYEAMSKKVRESTFLTDHPEFQQLYNELSPKSKTARVALEDFVSVARGGEYSDYKNQPWAREDTLKEIKKALQNGITVKEGSGGGSGGGSGDNKEPKNDSTPPWEGSDDHKPKKPNMTAPIAEAPDIDAEQQARIEAEKKAEAEKAAAEAAEKRRIEEEKIAKASEKKVSATADTSAFNQKLFDAIEKLSNDIEAAFKSMMNGVIDEDQLDDQKQELIDKFRAQFQFKDKGKVGDILFEHADDMGVWNSKKIYKKIAPKLNPEDPSWPKLEMPDDKTPESVGNIEDAQEKARLEAEAAESIERQRIEAEKKKSIDEASLAMRKEELGGNIPDGSDDLSGSAGKTTPVSTINTTAQRVDINTPSTVNINNPASVELTNATINLPENVQQKNDSAEDVAATTDKPTVVVEPMEEVESKNSIQTEELRQLLSAITYNVKVIQDAEPTEDNKISIDEAALESVLNRITYNVKIAHDDADKVENKVAIDEGALEQTLNKVFANILNTEVEQTETEPKNEPWALEDTLNTTIKGVLDQIQTNTAKIGTTDATPSDTIGVPEVTSKLTEIKSVLDSINAKIAKGGVIATRGAVKQAATQSVEPDVKAQAARSNMMKSLINDYKTMGKLVAQFASDGNLETRATLDNLKEEIKRKRESLKITMDENSHLREKYSIAFDAEKRLLEAEKQQKAINDQRKADVKTEKKRLTDAKKLAQREAMLGKAGNAVGRAENTWMSAFGLEGELPADFVGRIDDYYEKLDSLRKKHQELKNSDIISEEQKNELIAQTMGVNKMTEEIGELVAEYQKLSGDNATVIGTNTLGSGAGLYAYEEQLKQAVAAATNGKAQIKNFDAATKTLTYTVKTGKHEFTEYTAAVRNLDGQLVSVQGATKRTETFFEATARKMKELTSYFSGMAVFNRVGQELRRGIQYVREIDLALTDLKKVTDETEETYDAFLQTAAKTGEKLGATISAVTEATATFSKLGYSMEQATDMAESAIVYKNVGDNIASTEDAADSIISTMKGFRLEASESMAIVDRFNEVGNRFAITSQGIGEALRLSASALSEGGNSLDESIGLITAANEVVNDPSSVGTALKTKFCLCVQQCAQNHISKTSKS